MRHFIYQDEKSHKFWAVEQQGNELHISWGKVGTQGQSQVKSFADAVAAEKAELKLIAEKVKKGYVEQAKDNSLQPSQTVTDSLKVADLSTIIQEQPSFVAKPVRLTKIQMLFYRGWRKILLSFFRPKLYTPR